VYRERWDAEQPYQRSHYRTNWTTQIEDLFKFILRLFYYRAASPSFHGLWNCFNLKSVDDSNFIETHKSVNKRFVANPSSSHTEENKIYIKRVRGKQNLR
jgi:hypothetical protein